MKSKITGVVFYCLAAVMTVYALSLLLPVWIGWYQTMVAAFMAAVTEAVNSLQVYQSEHPAELGMVTLFAALVLFAFGWIFARVGRNDRNGREEVRDHAPQGARNITGM